jgi:predicted HTH transcriptional regulator
MEPPVSGSLSSNSLLSKLKKPHSKPLDPASHLIERVGIGIVSTVERYYEKYNEKPNEANATAYCTWRLRLHRRLKNDRDLLDAINKARNLGLYDEKPGNLCWDYKF